MLVHIKVPCRVKLVLQRCLLYDLKCRRPNFDVHAIKCAKKSLSPSFDEASLNPAEMKITGIEAFGCWQALLSCLQHVQ